jgi:hypothetical protein
MSLSRSQTPFLVATNVLTSWLDSLKIPYRLTTDSTIMIGDVAFRLYDSQGQPLGFSARNLVDVREIASCNPQVSLGAFWAITQVAGYGKPDPMRSSCQASRRQQAGFSALRLAEYAQAPDLSQEILKNYQPVILATVNSFFFNWGKSMGLRKASLTREDLLNAGIIWATNFHHRYRRASAEDNRRLLRHYIQQRINHCLTLSASKTKAVTSMVSLDKDGIEQLEHEHFYTPEETGRDAHTQDLAEQLAYMPPAEFRIRLQRAVEKNPELGWLATRYSQSLQRRLTKTIVE